MFPIFSEVCQNISKCRKLNRPQLRLLSIVFRTWFSTAWSIEFKTTVNYSIKLLDFNESCSNAFYLKEMLNNLCLLSFSDLDRSIDIKECDIRRNPYESSNNKRAARRDRNILWHDGVIPYQVHTSIPGMMYRR